MKLLKLFLVAGVLTMSMAACLKDKSADTSDPSEPAFDQVLDDGLNPDLEDVGETEE